MILVQIAIKQVRDLTANLDAKASADFSNVSASISIITSSPYNILGNQYLCIINRSSPSVISLPASPGSGKMLIVKDGGGNAATHNITIQGNGKNIDGASSLVMSSNYGSISLVYNGTQWNVV